MSDISYGELYAGIHLSQDPSREERRVQILLAVNRIETRLPGTLDIAKRAGQPYSSYLRKWGGKGQKDAFVFGMRSQLLLWAISYSIYYR